MQITRETADANLGPSRPEPSFLRAVLVATLTLTFFTVGLGALFLRAEGPNAPAPDGWHAQR